MVTIGGKKLEYGDLSPSGKARLKTIRAGSQFKYDDFSSSGIKRLSLESYRDNKDALGAVIEFENTFMRSPKQIKSRIGVTGLSKRTIKKLGL